MKRSAFVFVLTSILTFVLPHQLQAQTQLEIELAGATEAGCGDLIGVVATLSPNTTSPVPDAIFELNIPPSTQLDFDPAISSSPVLVNLVDETVTVLEGFSPGDTRLRVLIEGFAVERNLDSISVFFRIDPDFAGTLNFGATLSGSTFDTVQDTHALAVECTSTTPAPDVAATKIWALAGDADGDGLPDPGDRLRYTAEITVDGTGEFVSYQATPTDHLTLVAGTVTTSAGTVLSGNGAGDLSVQVAFGDVTNSSLTLTYEAVIDKPVPGDVTEVECQGGVSGDNFPPLVTDDPTTPVFGDPTVTPLDFDPDLAVTKSSPVAAARPGDVVPFEITAVNLGRATPATAFLEEVVPDGSVFNTRLSSSGWNCTPDTGPGATCRLFLGVLSPLDGPDTRTFALEITSPLPPGAVQLTNTVVITDDGSAGPDTDPTNNSDTATVALEGSPRLAAEKNLLPRSDPSPGGLLVWEITARNDGSREALDVFLFDLIPEHTRFVTDLSDPAWDCPSPTPGTLCLLSVGTLPAGESRTAAFAVRLDSPLPADLTELENCAAAGETAIPAEPAETCQTSPLPGGSPDLAVTKSDGGATVRPGQAITYTLDVANLGTREATGVLLEDTVPEHTVFDPSASSNGWLCTGSATAGDVCRLELGALDGGGATRQAVFAARVDATLPAGVTAIANTTVVSDDGASGPDADPDNNQDTEETPLVEAMPELRLSKSLLPTSDPRPGGLLAWTLTVSNDGNQEAIGVEIVETVPPQTTFRPGESSPEWSCEAPDAGATCRLTVGSLTAGEVQQFDFAVEIAETLPAGFDAIENCANLDGPADAGMVEACSPVTVEEAAPDLAVSKSDADAVAVPGGTVVYEISYTNLGNQTATGVVLEDVLPPEVDFLPDASDPGWTCEPSSGTSLCRLDVGTLAPGERATARITIGVPEALGESVTELTDTARIHDDGANGEDSDPSNNETEETTPVEAPPPAEPARLEADLTDILAQDVPPPGAGAGDTVAYVARLENVGGQPAQQAFFEIIPDPHTLLAAGTVETSAGAVLAGNAPGDTGVAVKLGSLEPGEPVTVVFEVGLTDIPPDLVQIEAQGLLSAANASEEPTDDPDTPADDDPTVTPLEHLSGGPDPAAIPTVGEVGLAVLALLLVAVALPRLRQIREVAS